MTAPEFFTATALIAGEPVAGRGDIQVVNPANEEPLSVIVAIDVRRCGNAVET